ncbi:MAG: radC [Ignavibacteria bacterium]|nr:radC [Ignavibacteria bacterium]
MKSKDKLIRYSSEANDYKSIRNWRPDERPRERLFEHGAHTLSDAELLAILIGQGLRNFSAIDISKLLLEKFGNLSELASKDISEFQHIKGIGFAKAVALAAAFELGKRIRVDSFSEIQMIQTPQDVANIFIPRLRYDKKEKFRTLLLNTKNQIVREVVVSEGTLNETLVHPREVFRLAITEPAASIILLHNHPSGSTQPSKEDIALTKILVKASEIIGIKILDHIIIAGENFYSFTREGLIAQQF